MKVRRLVVAFAALIAGPTAWVAGAVPAHAGGPTSVLLSNPSEGRVGAIHQSQSDYQRLVELVGAYDPVAGDTARPTAVTDAADTYRMTWMIHDMSVWRIDLVYETPDGIWVETKVDPTGAGDIFAREARWTELPRSDKAALSAVFRNAGILDSSPVKEAVPVEPAPEVAAGDVSTAPSGPNVGIVAVGAGLAGLAIGAGGMLLLRRARPTSPRPGTVLTG